MMPPGSRSASSPHSVWFQPFTFPFAGETISVSAPARLVVTVFQLAGLDRDVETVLRRRQRAGRIRRECARRGVGLVEVQNYLPFFWHFGVQETAGAVSRLARRKIPEYEEEPVVFKDRIQPVVTILEPEGRVSGAWLVLGL